MTKYNQIIPAIFLIVKRGDEILLQRRYHTGFQDGMYTFISGHVEKSESPRSAACREAKEEAGIAVHPQDLVFEQVLFRTSFARKGNRFDASEPERVDIFFSTEKWKGEPSITEPDKCDDLRWFPLADLPKNMFEIVARFMKSYPHVSSFEEVGY